MAAWEDPSFALAIGANATDICTIDENVKKVFQSLDISENVLDPTLSKFALIFMHKMLYRTQ